MPKLLKTSVQYLKGVGPKSAKLFYRLGIQTAEDLLYNFPRRYEDRSKFVSISQLKENEFQTILATILASSIRRSPRRKILIVELVASDKTGKIKCLWFNQPYLKKYLEVGQKIILYGKPEIYQGKLQFNSPEYEILEKEEQSSSLKESLNIGRIVPIYNLTEGLTQKNLRKIIKKCLMEFIPSVSDILPYDIRNRLKLLNLAQSLNQIHFPDDFSKQQEAFKRISFEEFFLYQLPVISRKLSAKERKGHKHIIDNSFIEEVKNCLPFKLTESQKIVLDEITKDMATEFPMHRLLQGDVGCGKTIVAFLSCLIALKSGYQVAFMVPTEILALQHFSNFSRILKSIKVLNKLKIGLLTGSLDKKSQQSLSRKIKQGKLNLVIGTHSLIDEDLQFNNLGLVVIDEQHKFGVSQRALLPQKGINPDLLIMTATPIPRTLTLTIYGDLDISVINEMPPGREKVKTMHFPEEKHNAAYDFVKNEIGQGKQAYIIYPLIEESETLDLKAAKQMYEQLRKNEFRDFKLGLIHGRMKKEEMELLMQPFSEGKIDILVATTVLEVGIDVSNATCMVIEHAQRFGLSQLHQLRGRVARGKAQSYCLLISSPTTEDAKARIKAITESNDGFKIAEEDLRIRGPGEFFGKRQHGLSELKLANPLTQLRLLKLAREEAIKLLKQDPTLSLRQNMALKELLKVRFLDYERFTKGG